MGHHATKAMRIDVEDLADQRGHADEMPVLVGVPARLDPRDHRQLQGMPPAPLDVRDT